MCFQTHGSICTAPKCFTTVFLKKQHGHVVCLLYYSTLPTLSKKAYMCACSHWLAKLVCQAEGGERSVLQKQPCFFVQQLLKMFCVNFLCIILNAQTNRKTLTSAFCLVSMAPRLEWRAPMLYSIHACSNLMSAMTWSRPVWLSSLKHQLQCQATGTLLLQFVFRAAISMSRDSLFLRACDPKIESSNPGRSGGRIFFSRVNFVCWLLSGVCFAPMLLQWHVKDPGHSVIRAGGRLHLHMQAPLTQPCQSGLTMPLSRHRVGIYQETSLHLHTTHWETLSHSRLSLLSHCGLILA